MTKILNRKFLITSLLIVVLTISTVFAMLPSTYAQEQNLQAKSLSILNDVLNIKSEDYNVTYGSQKSNQFLVNYSKNMI